MTYARSTFEGDAQHPICCTGDACKGDNVAFERATFGGSFRNATFEGFQMIVGEIVADSYGKARQQHTFTLRLADGSHLRIKGRNLYANGIYRAPRDESERRAALNNKHGRGDLARAARAARVEREQCA